ncbi:MAG: hypothetical protein LBD79_02900 [Treponema sp.]|nr:hypothetical protein [Treponema sp.]
MSKETINEYYGTLYSSFQSYFEKIKGYGNDPAENIKAVLIYIHLDDTVIIEFVRNNVRDGYAGGFSYVYVTEPANITGQCSYKYDGGDTTYYEHYDCNFTKAGWYKICNSYDTKPVNPPIDNAKFEKSEF